MLGDCAHGCKCDYHKVHMTGREFRHARTCCNKCPMDDCDKNIPTIMLDLHLEKCHGRERRRNTVLQEQQVSGEFYRA